MYSPSLLKTMNCVLTVTNQAGGAVVASNLPLQAHFARPSAGLGSIPMDAPGFDSETSGELSKR